MVLDEEQLAELARMLALAQSRTRPPCPVVPMPERPRKEAPQAAAG